MKNYDKITAIAFCAFLAVFSVLFIFLPGRTFSEQENRELASAPELSARSLFDGTFADGVNVWFADQFPGRDAMVKLKSAAEQLLLKQSNNGVLYSRDQLAVKQFDAYRSRLYKVADADGFFESSVSAQADSLVRAAEKVDIPVITLVPPRTIDVCGEKFGYPGHGDALFELLESALSEKAGYIDTLGMLREGYGDYLIYRTDHHWTTAGAYRAYVKIAEKLGMGEECLPETYFTKEKIPGFYGTTAARGNFVFCKNDVLEIWTAGDDGDYSVVADGKEIGGFYDRSRLDTSDKYSVFLGGTHGTTVITKKGGENRKKMLIIKDSFANCLIPFLARGFDIVALDIKSGVDIAQAVRTYGADVILVVCNAENVVSDGSLGRIY